MPLKDPLAQDMNSVVNIIVWCFVLLALALAAIIATAVVRALRDSRSRRRPTVKPLVTPSRPHPTVSAALTTAHDVLDPEMPPARTGDDVRAGLAVLNDPKLVEAARRLRSQGK